MEKPLVKRGPGPCLSIKTVFPGMGAYIIMIKDKMVKRPSYLYNGNTGKTASLNWIVSVLYLPQHLQDTFYIHPSYQPTSEKSLIYA